MPNHIQNRVRITGEQSRIDELLKAVRNDEEGLGSIDFNTGRFLHRTRH